MHHVLTTRPAVLLACTLGLAACGKSEPETAPSAPSTSLPSATAPAAPPVQPPAPKAEPADPATPLDRYQRLNAGKQLMFAYLAVSPNPLDYDRIAKDISDDYDRERDEFKKRELLNALKPQIDAEIEKAKQNKYYVFHVRPQLGNYNFERQGFEVNALSDDPTMRFPGARHALQFSNAADFSQLKVSDETAAREIENLRAHGDYDALQLHIYVHAAETEIGESTIRGRIMKLRLLDKNGKLLAEQ